MATSLSSPKLIKTLTFQTLFRKFHIFSSSTCQKLDFYSFRNLREPRRLVSRCRRFTATTSLRAESTNGVGDESKPHYDFDLFTIGAGSGGVRASRFAANFGASFAVCELPFSTISSDIAGGVGGTCVLRGCVPKKLLVYASNYGHEFEESRGFGWVYETDPKHDWSTLIANKNAELQRLTGIYKNILNNAGVKLIEGRGKVGRSFLDEFLFRLLSQTLQ